MAQLAAASAPLLSLPFLGVRQTSLLSSGIAPSKKNLEHYWRFEDDPATQVIIDEMQPSSIAWNCFGNAVTSVSGVIGNGLHDDNLLMTISNPDNQHVLAHVDNRDFTYSIWVKPDDLSTDRVVFQIIQDAISNPFPGNNECEIVYDHTANRYKWTVVNDTATSTTSTTVTANTFGAPSTGSWTLIVVWYDKTNQQIGIAVNGLEDTASCTLPIHFVLPSNDPHNPFHAVFWPNWNGAFDESGWWSRLLSDQERLGLYNNGAGRAYSTFTTAPNAWVEFGHGGAVAGGKSILNSDVTATGGVVGGSSALVSVIVGNVNGTGGAVVGGTSTALLRCSPVLSGGAVVGSTATNTENASNIATGGAVVGGVATNTVVVFNTAAGGAVVGGAAPFGDFGVMAGGRATVSCRYAVVTTGGLVVGGLAWSQAGIPLGGGGVKLGGHWTDTGYWHHSCQSHIGVTATASTRIVDYGGATATVTITADASTRIYASENGRGGIVCGGVAAANSITTKAVGGGVVAGSTARVSRRNNISGTGGSVGGGQIVQGIGNIGRGGVLGNSTAAQFVIWARTASGGSILGGTGIVSLNRSNTATGGIVAAGTDMVVTRHPAQTGGGGGRIGGSAYVPYIYKQVATGGVKAGTTGLVVRVQRPAATGGVVAGGSARVSHVNNITASGGVYCILNTGPLWTPANITLAAWFKADSLSLSDGNPVSYWNDLSGNHYDLAMPFSAQQPTYETGIVNGLPAVRFDDNSPTFTQPKNMANRSGFSVPAVISQSQPMLIAVMANVSEPNTQFAVIQTFSGNSFSVGGTFFSTPHSFVYNVSGFTPGEGFKSVQYFAGINWNASIGGWRLTEGLANTSSSDIFLDGTSVNNGGTTTVSNSGFTGMILGNFLNADVLEIIITTDISLTTRQRIEGYTAWRAGTQANLPPAHPYKTAAPRQDIVATDTAVVSITHKPTVSGGGVAGGLPVVRLITHSLTTGGGVVTNGVAFVPFHYKDLAEGGVAAGGVAVDTEHHRSVTASATVSVTATARVYQHLLEGLQEFLAG